MASVSSVQSLGPNVFTTPITAMRCQQCLPLSVVQLKGKHCPKHHCRNGVVNTFEHYLEYVKVIQNPAFTSCPKTGCEKSTVLVVLTVYISSHSPFSPPWNTSLQIFCNLVFTSTSFYSLSWLPRFLCENKLSTFVKAFQ